ncbi:Ku protein [Rhodoplanes sp. TEM]|uniref:Non-homologous end joining protein Ku n=1 Tax=Rhodoplanes tepidamans TaxID=200616 RepID=A0ABT5J950_RHOTP|nr:MULTISPECIES: Ku protein [Rhodoplanes]MDC7786134.1 Ku protein [Rhodoplanes tepidamans]MDC7982801.1 Ku protein [Rhodoplanes sp. TEM]MDQ0357201.1 DNA end-binding protein Ku [Rhodoplanes tepidamans]
MAPRANWKGYLRLSLVSCPIALYPATTDREKIRLNLLDKATGHRIRMQKVDADTGEPVEAGDIVKGYKTADGYVEITSEDLESIEIESSRTLDITRFVPHEEIDDLYNVRPYYVVPDGEAGRQAFAVIREAIRARGMVALGRVVISSREHVIALEPRGKGLMGTLLRYPYEVRDEAEFFDDIPDEPIPKEMIELATHIIDTMKGEFRPDEFEDRYETALRELIARKENGEAARPTRQKTPSKVVNLMDALRRSVEAQDGAGPGHPRKPVGRGAATAKKARGGTSQRRRRAG